MRIIVFAGLPGTGKSTLARMVAARTGAAWLRVDSVEAALLEAGVPQSFETGLAAYIGVRDLARDQLHLGHDVVIDAVNGVAEARAMWRDLAEEFHVPRHVVHVTCTDAAEHRRRVEGRAPATPPLPKPTWDEVSQREFQPWDEPVLEVDNQGPPERMIERILGYCSEPAPHARSGGGR
jgi:predicted kinase